MGQNGNTAQEGDDPDRPYRRRDLDTDVVILASIWQARKDEIADLLDSRSGWRLVDGNELYVTVRFEREQDASELREMMRK